MITIVPLVRLVLSRTGQSAGPRSRQSRQRHRVRTPWFEVRLSKYYQWPSNAIVTVMQLFNSTSLRPSKKSETFRHGIYKHVHVCYVLGYMIAGAHMSREIAQLYSALILPLS